MESKVFEKEMIPSHKKMTFLRQSFFLILICLVVVGGAYRTCDGTAQKFDGYTYIVDSASKERVWSHCAFFNPSNDHALCGWPRWPGHEYYLCDPDHLLGNGSSRNAVEESLALARSQTATICLDAAGERIRVVVAVAMIDRIRIPDLHHPDLCMNECGQLQPWIDNADWYPNDQEQDEILQVFADGLRAVWKLEQCENDLIVVYCKEFNKVQISAGQGVSKYITQNQLSQIKQDFMQYAQGTNHTDNVLRQGLLSMLQRLRETLKSVHVAFILIFSVLALCVAMFVWFLAYAAQYYMEVKFLRHVVFSYPWKGLTWLLKLLSGISLIRHLMLLQLRIPRQGLGLALLGLVMILMAWIVLYFIGPGSLRIHQPN